MLNGHEDERLEHWYLLALIATANYAIGPLDGWLFYLVDYYGPWTWGFGLILYAFFSQSWIPFDIWTMMGAMTVLHLAIFEHAAPNYFARRYLANAILAGWTNIGLFREMTGAGVLHFYGEEHSRACLAEGTPITRSVMRTLRLLFFISLKLIVFCNVVLAHHLESLRKDQILWATVAICVFIHFAQIIGLLVHKLDGPLYLVIYRQHEVRAEDPKDRKSAGRGFAVATGKPEVGQGKSGRCFQLTTCAPFIVYIHSLIWGPSRPETWTLKKSPTRIFSYCSGFRPQSRPTATEKTIEGKAEDIISKASGDQISGSC